MDEKVEAAQDVTRENIPLLPFLAVLIGSIMLVITLLLPFASANNEREEWLKEHPDSMYVEEIGMTNKESVNISMLEFGRIYKAASEMEEFKLVGIICLVLISAFALFVALTALFAILKKPIAIMIFDALSFAVFCMLKWDFKDRGVIPSSSYDWGIAQYFCYLGVIVAFAGAVMLLTVKIKQKKRNKGLQMEEEK